MKQKFYPKWTRIQVVTSKINRNVVVFGATNAESLGFAKTIVKTWDMVARRNPLSAASMNLNRLWKNYRPKSRNLRQNRNLWLLWTSQQGVGWEGTRSLRWNNSEQIWSSTSTHLKNLTGRMSWATSLKTSVPKFRCSAPISPIQYTSSQSRCILRPRCWKMFKTFHKEMHKSTSTMDPGETSR